MSENEMDCDIARPWVYLLDDELDGEETVRLGAHLAVCASCRVEREEFLAARERLLVPEVPPLRVPLRPFGAGLAAPSSHGGRLGVTRWARPAIAAAAAVLIGVAAWMDGVLRPADPPHRAVARNEAGPIPPGARRDTLAPARYRFDTAASGGLVVSGLPEIPRQRVAVSPDSSWAQGRSPQVPREPVRESAVGLPDGGTDILLARTASEPPPRVGRLDAGRWEMADVVVKTSLGGADSPDAGAGGWKTLLRVGDR